MARRADERKLSEWRARFERFRQGGQSVVRFCARECVSVPSFYQWRRKLNGTPPTDAGLADANVAHVSGRSPASSAFAPVRLVGVSSLTAWLPGGTRLEIPVSDVRLLPLAIETLARVDGERVSERPGRGGGASC